MKLLYAELSASPHLTCKGHCCVYNMEAVWMLILTYMQTVIDVMDDKKPSWDLFTNREAFSLLFSVVSRKQKSTSRDLLSPSNPPPLQYTRYNKPIRILVRMFQIVWLVGEGVINVKPSKFINYQSSAICNISQPGIVQAADVIADACFTAMTWDCHDDLAAMDLSMIAFALAPAWFVWILTVMPV